MHKDLKVIWIDAHPDTTNPALRNKNKVHVDNPHGMPLSLLTGLTDIPKLPYWNWLHSRPFLDPKNVVLIAIRDIDDDEWQMLPNSGIKMFTVDHIDKYGIGEVMRRAI